MGYNYKSSIHFFFQHLIGGLMLVGTASAQQEITVNGQVTDENNKPLSRAIIVLEGTEQGTTTDLDGRYTIDVAEAAQTLLWQDRPTQKRGLDAHFINGVFKADNQ